MKMKKKKLFTLITILVLLLAVGLMIADRTHWGLSSTAGTSARNIKSLSGKTNTNRIDFFKHYGWDVSAEPCEISDVAIPREFDQVFEDYNKIQKSQGMDLSRYKGKVAKRYSYVITNYPQHTENIRGNMIVYEGNIIACDVCSLELNGFMHGIINPS